MHEDEQGSVQIGRAKGGGCTMQARNPDSWEGWYWGAKHIWGQDPVGEGDQYNLFNDVAKNSDSVLFPEFCSQIADPILKTPRPKAPQGLFSCQVKMTFFACQRVAL